MMGFLLKQLCIQLQIIRTVEEMEERNDVEQLTRFLLSLPPPVQIKVGLAEPVLRARALICYNMVKRMRLIFKLCF